jgi:hypothetical protein
MEANNLMDLVDEKNTRKITLNFCSKISTNKKRPYVADFFEICDGWAFLFWGELKLNGRKLVTLKCLAIIFQIRPTSTYDFNLHNQHFLKS